MRAVSFSSVTPKCSQQRSTPQAVVPSIYEPSEKRSRFSPMWRRSTSRESGERGRAGERERVECNFVAWTVLL